MPLLYDTYQLQQDWAGPARMAARVMHRAATGHGMPAPGFNPMRALVAACEVIALTTLTHTRPSFGIDRICVGGQDVTVREDTALSTPFASLLRFAADDDRQDRPRVLLVAPLSGHFSTLLRATLRTLLIDHDVYVTDWLNPRDIPLSAGRFGLDEYVLHLVRFMEHIGAGAHVVAVCQPTVAALAAVALMSEDGHAACPRTMTLMAGPIDTRINPTKVNRLATERPIEWFEQNLIGTVPARHAGAGRRVYPGFVQVGAFMSMNMERHVKAITDFYLYRLRGDEARAEALRAFYEEYFATMDLPAEFYLETVSQVFQRHALPTGTLAVAGRPIEPRAIRRTALLTIEGERDDICAIGQTLAAQDLCSGLRPYMRMHHVQPGVGHYGVFSGRKWESGIYPLVREFTHRFD